MNDPGLPGGRARGVRAGAGIALAAAAAVGLGALLGVVWELVSPRVTLTMTAGGLVLDEVGGALSFDATGWLTVIAAAVGLVAGVLGVARVRGARSVRAAVLDTVLAGVAPLVLTAVAWAVGHQLGRGASAAQTTAVAVGGTVEAPIAVGTRLVLAVGPLVALAVVAVFSLWPVGRVRSTPERATPPDPGTDGVTDAPGRVG